MILVILGCTAFWVFILSILSACSNNHGLCHLLSGATIAFSISFVVTYSLVGYYSSIPSSIDVYQNKTTLEYTIRDGEIVDSVVVFKEYEKN